jgi:predicted acylesterase/phospholipase RssA
MSPDKSEVRGKDSKGEKGGEDRPKRAICLAGGGPAAGLHIGVLEGLQHNGLKFDGNRSVWALSCIGAWVGIVYNQAKEGREIEETYNFFHDVFRDDKSFQSFPTNTIFAPDWMGNLEAIQDFLFEPNNYKNAFLPRQMMRSFIYTMSCLGDRKAWRNFSEGDFNRWTLNHVLAVNPATRFLTALLYKSQVNGLARLYYPDGSFLRDIKFKELEKSEKPFIYHNAWNLSKQELYLFSNKRDKYKYITPASLCACSALPYVEQTVEIDGDTYCEGALVDTVNFERLLQDHPDLDEIWISRIVDAKQIRAPRNLTDSLANLCQQFAATVGEDDVKLFKYHVQENNRKSGGPKWTGTIVEIKVDSHINFNWSHSNLNNGRSHGKHCADRTFRKYEDLIGEKQPGQLLIID